MIPKKPGIFTVVLTGGIASGKSAASHFFEELGVPVIDTDRIARELVEPGMPALRAIVEKFGPECLNSDGRLDRPGMRSLIFAEPKAKTLLESILHPLIGEEVLRRISALDATYCIVVIPLFAENTGYSWIDRVLVIDAKEETQVARVMERDHISRQMAEAILANQAGRQERLALADEVIVNEGTIEQLEACVGKLHLKYLELAQSAG